MTNEVCFKSKALKEYISQTIVKSIVNKCYVCTGNDILSDFESVRCGIQEKINKTLRKSIT